MSSSSSGAPSPTTSIIGLGTVTTYLATANTLVWLLEWGDTISVSVCYAIHVKLWILTGMPTVKSILALNNKWCVKCGVAKKSRVLSCCARGGAWFKNCGGAGDTQFDHTWLEGIQACKRFVSSVPLESPLQAMFRHAGVIAYPRNTTETQNTTRHVDGTADFQGCAGLAKVLVYVYVLFIVL